MFIVLLYTSMIAVFIYGLHKLPKTKIDHSLSKKSFSIVIPFRNEEASLDALLNSIQKLNYPTENFEIILVDDESTDNSVEIMKEWTENLPNIILINNIRTSISPKKDAIQTGIKASKFDWILTTDADCVLPENWLQAYNTIIQKNKSLFIAGPLTLKSKTGFIHQYQLMDILSLLGVTMGSFGINKPMMCNAANMGFDKTAYINLQNTTNNTTVSGDDIFTLESFVKTDPEKVHYLNTTDALVTTNAENNWKAVIQQRIRWAAKSTQYQSLFTKGVGVIVLATQLYLILGFFFCIFSTTILWAVKLILDAVLINTIAKKTNQKILFIAYLKSALVYPFLNSYIGIKALIGGYTWKERSFKR